MYKIKGRLPLALLILLGLMINCGKDKKPFLLFPGGDNAQEEAVNTNKEDTSSGNEGNNQGDGTQINDQCGPLDYDFQTTVDVSVQITVLDIDGPVQGAIVSIINPSNNNTLFQAATNENGVVTGIAQISTNTTSVLLQVKVGDEVVYSDTISNRCDLNQFLVRIERQIASDDDLNNDNPVDSDGDGTPDSDDDYPDDPTRAKKVVLPESVIAFEDLYPVPGDADFNDVVVSVSNEEDLNTQGQVVRIRGKYKFLAKGAGYNHVVLIQLPGSGTVIQKIYDGNNNLVNEINTHADSLQKLPVFLKDSLYFANPVYTSSSIYRTHELCSHNSKRNNVYIPCYSSEVEIIFDEPQVKSKATSAPYDFYIYVLNTGKEIHFPGLYVNNGDDQYLDDDGFPWALLLPSKWNWPYERTYITNGYPCFDEWYLSNGTNYTDWYLRVDATSQSNIFPYFNDINYENTDGCR